VELPIWENATRAKAAPQVPFWKKVSFPPSLHPPPILQKLHKKRHLQISNFVIIFLKFFLTERRENSIIIS